MNKQGFVSIQFLDHENKWQAFRYFNGNAYPQYVRSIVNSCWRRFSLIFCYYENMQTVRLIDVQDFLALLNENAQQLKAKKKDLPIEVSYESVGHISYFYMILIMVKSFLDIWAQVSTILINPRARIRGFNQGRIDGEVLAGGRFINWLRGSVPKAANIENLIYLVTSNSKEWITSAVDYRDDIVHYGEINDIKPLRMILRGEPKDSYKETDILHASMPDGTLVSEYSRNALARLNSFVIEFIKLLPDIDKTFLSLVPIATLGN